MTHAIHVLIAASLLAAAPAPRHTIVTAMRPAAFQQGVSDSLARAAQNELNAGNFRRASDLYADLLRRFPRSTRAADALYYRAFALSRIGGRNDLVTALEELDRYAREYGNGAQADDARNLRTRVCGELMQAGDERCGREVVERATTRSSPGSGSGSGPGRGAGSGPGSGAGTGPGTGSASTRGGNNNNNNRNRDDDDDDRIMAVNALLQMNSASAVPILKDILARRDAGSAALREKAVFIISQKSSVDVVDVLLNVVKTDPDAEVRAQAVFWMGQTRDPRVVDVLQDLLLKSNDEEVQNKAIFSLGQVGSTRSRQILRDYATRRGADTELRGQAIFWLGQSLGEGGVTFLRELYGQVTEDELKDKVIFALSQTRAGRPVLFEIAKDSREDTERRGQAIFWISQSGGSGELISLYATLDDRELRNKIVFGLSQTSGSAAVDKLIDIAKNDKDKEVRSQAVFWLGQSSDPRAIKFLRELINR